jgi:hypothetical protein
VHYCHGVTHLLNPCNHLRGQSKVHIVKECSCCAKFFSMGIKKADQALEPTRGSTRILEEGTKARETFLSRIPPGFVNLILSVVPSVRCNVFEDQEFGEMSSWKNQRRTSFQLYCSSLRYSTNSSYLRLQISYRKFHECAVF